MIRTAMAPSSAGTHAKKTVKPRSTESPMLAMSILLPPSLDVSVETDKRRWTPPGYGLPSHSSKKRLRALAVALPDEPQAVQRQLGVDRGDRAGVRGNQVGEPARRDDGRLGCAELLTDALDDRVHLSREAVDEPRLQCCGGGLADHPLGRRERHLRQAGRAGEEGIH